MATDLGHETRMQRLLLRAATLLGLAMVVGMSVYVSLRLFYPYELEWMEGAMVDHCTRVRMGLDLYVEPGPEHVQFLYTPLLYYFGALVAAFVGDGFFAPRFVSLLATIACAFVIHRWIRRESSDDPSARAAAWIGVGLLCGGYAYLQSWYDLARNDMLMLAFLLGSAWFARFGSTRQQWLAAGLAALAFLAKQTAVMWLPAILVGSLLQDRRRGIVLGVATVCSIGAVVLGYHITTDGWFTFFVFEMPSYHGSQQGYVGIFLDDLTVLLPLIALTLTATVGMTRDPATRGQGLFLLAFGGGGLVASFMSRKHAGGFDNVVCYMFAAGCVLGMLALRGARGTRRTIVLSLVLLQFALLIVDPRSLWSPRPWLLMGNDRFLPTASHRQGNEELLHYLKGLDGPVMMPFHGHLPHMTGREMSAHGQAIYDLSQTSIDENGFRAELHPAMVRWFEQTAARLAEGHYAALILDEPHGHTILGLFTAHLGRYAEPVPIPLDDPYSITPAVGMRTHSPKVLLRL